MAPLHQQDRSISRHKKTRLAAVGVTAAAGLVAVAVSGVWAQNSRKEDLVRWTAAQAVPTVQVVTPGHGAKNQELVLPGSIKAYYEAPIYARVNGYLLHWYKDIGAHVKKGDLLADIDTPDLDQQLRQAQADLAQAKANEALAAVTAQRWQALVASNSVAQQETDEKIGEFHAKQAALQAAQANVERLQALEGFKRIVAPFDGVVTARKTDVGALINAGSGIGPELFAVADVHKLRVYVRVPQALAGGLKVGMAASLHLPEKLGATFPATVTNLADAINDASRTELVELEADNPSGDLVPGTYAEVHFKLPNNPNILRIPTSALLFQEDGMQVATVGANDKVTLKSVSLGRDLGTQVEIISGLSPSDRIINSPPDSIGNGETVHVADKNNADAPAPVKVGEK